MVYISTSALQTSMRSSLLSSQNDLANAQKELASGTYADLGLHLGASSGALLEIAQQQSRLDAYTASNAIATTRLTSTAATLTTFQSAATKFLASLTAATTTGASAAGLQQSAAANLSALIAGLNTTVGGDAVFGGINTAGQPVADYSADSASKKAVDGAFLAAFGTSQTSAGAASITASQMSSFLTGSFSTLFDASSFSATWSSASDQDLSTEIAPGQSASTSVSANQTAFRGLAQAYTMISEFTGSTLSASAQQAVIAAATSVVTQALGNLTGVQTQVGIVQGALSSANDQITSQTNLLTTQAGSMQDVDIYALNTRISSLQTQIEASYELTNSLQKLSLVNYFSA